MWQPLPKEERRLWHPVVISDKAFQDGHNLYTNGDEQHYDINSVEGADWMF